MPSHWGELVVCVCRSAGSWGCSCFCLWDLFVLWSMPHLFSVAIKMTQVQGLSYLISKMRVWPPLLPHGRSLRRDVLFGFVASFSAFRYPGHTIIYQLAKCALLGSFESQSASQGGIIHCGLWCGHKVALWFHCAHTWNMPDSFFQHSVKQPSMNKRF